MPISQCWAFVGCCVSPRIFNVFKCVFILFLSATPSFGATLVVPAGGDLQKAINNAASGDTIILEAGATYQGPFVLPNKPGDSYITIQSSRISEITGRVSMSQNGLLAKLRSNSPAEPIISTAPGAHHYKLIGLEISTFTSSDFVYDLVRLGAGDSTQNDLSSVPHHLILDRVWIHGFETQEVQRGISLNSAETFIINSYISDIHEVATDTQAICGWNGPGPFTITNNYLEAAGENIMFGGAPSSIPGLIPSNITISQNNFFKPLSWKIGDPSYGGIHWTVKNLLELKNARNVVINGNIFENNWTDGQAGYAILLTVRGEWGSNPWNTVQNVTFSNNTIRNSEQGFQLLGLDNLAPSVQGMNLTISNNLLENIPYWFLVNNGFHNVTLTHNTHFQRGNIYVLTGNQAPGFVSRDNITIHSGYGIKADGTEEGITSLQALCPGYVFTNNVVVGAPANLYPPKNFYPANVSDVQFVDYNGGNYRLQVTSPYHNAATDGTDIGVDMTALLAAQAGAASTPSPPPGPNPIFTTPFFVRQHYLDFLSREPEPGEPWTGVLNNCSDVNNNPACDRITVSGAFFGSPEFQLKGYFVYRFYKLAFNRLPAYTEIVTDMGLVTGQTQSEVFQKKAAFANAFAQGTEFVNTYNQMSNGQFVSALMSRYGLQQITTPAPVQPDGATKVTLSATELINGLNANNLTRAQVLRAIADSDQVFSMEFNRAFVAMQYYGYLRRTPDTPGYNAWLNFLNANPTDSRTMINGFLNSQEYRLRFGP